MDTLLDTKFRHQYVEGGIQHADDSSLPDDRTILLGQVRNEYTEVQMSGLLLRKSGTVLLAVDAGVWVGVQLLNKSSTYMLHC